ncbi:MAG TPA: Uma2 family endonuclease [Planctomycetaceae bacterium]|jgi:Uma2 family endonuclease
MGTITRKKKFVLGRRHNGMRMTPEEFDAISECDELYSYELINGVLIVSPFASRHERGLNDALSQMLRNYADLHPGVLETVFEEYIRVKNGRRRADRVIWVGMGHPPDPERDVPTIVIEFVSQRRRDWIRDYIEKKEEYLSLGVVEYWVISRFDRTLTVFTSGKTGIEERVVTEHEIFNTSLLPGFDLPLDKLLPSQEQRKQQ